MCETIFLAVVLYGCKTWSLTLREEHRLRAFENMVLRRIIGPKRGDVTGGRRKLHSEEFHNLYSPGIITMINKDSVLCRTCSTNGEKRNAYRILVEKPGRQRQVGKPRLSWSSSCLDCVSGIFCIAKHQCILQALSLSS
jgi:hypothetical protein